MDLKKINFNIYSRKGYKKLLIVPIILLAVAIFYTTQLTYGIDFSGGSRITVPLVTAVETHEFERKLNQEFDILDLSVKQTTGPNRMLSVEYVGQRDIVAAEEAFAAENYALAITNAQRVTGVLEVEGEGREAAREYINQAGEQFRRDIRDTISRETGVPEEEFSFSSVGAALGSRFLEQSRNAVIVALLLIAMLVFYFFKNIVTSLSVFQAAVFDMLIGIGAAGFFGIPITLGTIAALLMLIGYSIDSDIMVAERILKRKRGEPHERAFDAMKTGLTMTGTSLGAISVLFVVSYFTNIQILLSISIILIIGLIGDIFATWFTNVPLILWNIERGESK